MSRGDAAAGHRVKVLGWQEVSKAMARIGPGVGFDWRADVREHSASAALGIHPGARVLGVEINEGLSDEELRRLCIEPEPPDSDLFIVVTMTTVEIQNGTEREEPDG